MRSVAVSFLLLILAGCDAPLTYEYSGVIEKVKYYEIVRRDTKGYQRVEIIFQNDLTLEAFIAENDLKNLSQKEGKGCKIICQDADYLFFERESFLIKTITLVSTHQTSE